MSADKDMQIGKRGAPRVRVLLPAVLILTDRTVNCLIENISTGGARVHLGEAIRVGSAAYLQCGGLELFCTIIWSRSQRCGVVFEQELDPALVVSIRRYADEYAARARLEAQGDNQPWPPQIRWPR